MSIWFKVHEFDCHDGSEYPPDWVDTRLRALCSQLDPIREAFGKPLKVVSGYRSLQYNAAIGGAKLSQHVQGLAADVQPIVPIEHRTAEVRRLYELIVTMIGNQGLPLVGGVGFYPGKWVHVDSRPKPPDGHIARWTGTGIGSEVA